MATFLQTQRRRLRDHLKQRWAETGTVTLVNDTEFCSQCRRTSARLEKAIDRGFDAVSWRTEGYGVIDMSHLPHLPVKESRREECSLCDFLTYMLKASGPFTPGESEVSDRYCLDLSIGSAKAQYGISKDFSHISDSFSMYIRATSKWRLPQMQLLPYEYGFFYGGMALETSSDSGKISGRFVGPYPDFELIKSWFDDCTLHHGTTTCQTDASILQDISGLRVIDCSSRKLISWSHLPANQDRNYVALSYVWGTNPHDENDEKKNISDRTVDWPLPSKLPLLIEDTITAVTKLGFRYLWIDRYCIPQGDQEAKHTQIQNMDSIYGSASLTIIAATGNDPSQGLPGVSLPRYGHGRPDKNPPVSVRIGSRTFVTVDTSAAPSVLCNSMWESRAWTMQEAFLSCRCLVFFDDGAYFQCSSPRSHRFEAIHEPLALLQLRHVLSTKEQNIEKWAADSLILTKKGKAGDLKLGWCLQLVEDYFGRRMTFESDTLNAFSGILKYLHSLPRPVSNLWGVLMVPDVISTSTGQLIRYNLVRGLAWLYRGDMHVGDPISDNLGKLEGRTMTPRKEIFPSWTWAEWRPRVKLHGKYDISYRLRHPDQDSSFTSLVDLSVELDDGRIVSLDQGNLYDSDVSWLTTLPHPPRILHLQGYTANPQLRYMTEEEWADFNERTTLPVEEAAHDHNGNGDNPEGHGCDANEHRWVWIDADGQHLQPLLEPAFCERPRCWEGVTSYHRDAYDLSTNTYMYRGRDRLDIIKPYTECTFDFRVIVLGSQRDHVYYMILKKAPGNDSQTETFERVNVIHVRVEASWSRSKYRCTRSANVNIEEFLARLTGTHAEPFRGTPWVKMNTRIA